MSVSLMNTEKLNEFTEALLANDCEVITSKSAGTVTAYDKQKVVLKAIQKGPNGPWIVRFMKSHRISWSKP